MKITDVAREAGVSITTVSRALNGNYPVKAETKEKIEAAIKKLNYKPNAMARSMITRRTMTVGVITPGLTNLFFLSLIEKIESVVGAAGFKIAVCNSNGMPEAERAIAEDFCGRQMDGIIALDPSKENLDNGFFFGLSEELPLIVTNGNAGNYQGNFICYEEEKSTREALETLIRLGHKKIALIRGERSVSFNLREKIYHEVRKRNGLVYKKILFVEKGNSQAVVENTKHAVQKLLQGEDRPTAIFACNDLMAMAALNSCVGEKLKVPEDISVIGFDNTLLSVITNPRLSTVDLKIEEVGRLTAVEILRIIENRELKVHMKVETEFLLRESCDRIKKETGRASMDEKKRQCGFLIERLLGYCKGKGLLEELDLCVGRNQLMELFRLEKPIDGESHRQELQEALAGDMKEESPTAILEKLLDYGAELGLIPMNTITYRDLLDAKMMGLLMPRPSEVAKKFYGHMESEGPKAATDYLYELSKASNYIRMDRIKKNKEWKAPTGNGELEITINMSKPEKDPREIANQKQIKSGGYPKCLLCAENPGFQGNLNHPARQNLRIVPFKAAGENWYLQFSPYSYYEEHCILFHEHHIPMKISEKTFARLLDFVEAFPEYFIGSNADLPIVGGSILSHEHYQAGRHIFPLDQAKKETEFFSKKYPGTSLYILDWPISTVRVEGLEKKEVEALSVEVLRHWRGYSDETLGIFAETGEIHNTITPIARRGAQGSYILNLVLRNNRTDEAHPAGIFHAHREHQHLKRENIGLIEAMGLAILPARLATELEPIVHSLTGENGFECEEMHKEWQSEILTRFGQKMDRAEAERTLEKMIAEKFSAILDDCGVFKKNSEGRAGFKQFMATAGYLER